MKITLKTPKPRNPLIAAMRFRQAGPHRPQRGGARREGQRELRQELHRMTPSP